jgi:hypothetical protein
MAGVQKLFFTFVTAVAVVLTSGCGSDSDVVDPSGKLCGGRSGFAARISGTEEPIDMCVPDDETLTTIVPGAGDVLPRYVSTAALTLDSLQIEIEISFFVLPATPVTLQPTSNRAFAESDPGSVLFVYRESKPGDYDFETGTVSGTFTLTLVDESIAVASFSDLDIQLADVADGSSTVTRAISQGYLLISSGH